MTIQNFIDAIAETLFQEFGKAYAIYPEKVEQGLEVPCFLIRCINPTHNLDLGLRSKRTNQFSIQYIPSTAEANTECYAVMDRMHERFERISTKDGIFHGKDMNGEITDGVLTFTVNYDGFVLKETASTSMNKYGLATQVRR